MARLIFLSFFFTTVLQCCLPPIAYAGVSNGQPVSAAVTNAAFMDKNTTTTFTTALADIQGGIEVESAVDSTSTGSNQNVTLSAPITIFTNASLTSIQNFTFTNRSDATLVGIRNKTGASITLKHLSGGTSSHQIDTGIGADLTVANNAATWLYYDTVNSKWQIMAPLGVFPYSASGGTSNLVTRDSNGNIGANNFSAAMITYTPTGTLTLTAATPRVVVFASSGTNTAKLPDATTLANGATFEINNNSSGNTSVVDNSNGAVTTVTPGGYARVILTDNSTSAGTWDKHFLIPANATFGTSGLSVSNLSTSGASGASALNFIPGFGTSWVNGLSLGTNGTSGGSINLRGSSTGTVTVQPQAAAGTYNFNLPTTAGSSGQALTSGGGGSSAMTWSSILSNPMTTTGDIIYSSDNSGTAARLGIGSTGNYLDVSSGIPAWSSFTSHSITSKVATGTTAGYRFAVSGVTTAPTAGAVYTNNGNSYTVYATNNSKSQVWASGASAPLSSGTLTKSSGTGDSTITFSSATALASYTAPSTAKVLWVRLVGGGGSGGGCASTGVSTVAGSGGGGGGAYVEKWIKDPATTSFLYEVGAGGTGATAGNNNGNNGGITSIASSDGTIHILANGGSAGLGSAAISGPGFAVSFSNNLGCGDDPGDLTICGSSGQPGGCLSSGSQAFAGGGGGSAITPAQTALQNIGSAKAAAGVGYGQGSGGCANGNSQSTIGSNAGSGGVFIVHEFYNGN